MDIFEESPTRPSFNRGANNPAIQGISGRYLRLGL